MCRDSKSDGMQEADEAQVQTRIRYLLKVGNSGEELSGDVNDT